MNELRGKKVLLLAPSFFGYDIEIKNELINLGAKVYHYDERPKNDFFTKVSIRLNLKKLIQNKIDDYYTYIIDKTKELNVDYMLLINPETIDNDKIKSIKQHHPNIKVFIYMWDSIKNKKKSLELLENSDKFFTFDSEDKAIDSKIQFLPLFYVNDYKNIKQQECYQYDIAFIGTIHSDRYKTVKQIEDYAYRHNLKIFYYFYSPSRILFYLQKIFKKDFRHINKKDISFTSMSKDDIVKIITQSKIVIDIHHPLQNGLTMRTIEMIGAKRKLLTTNQKIKNYDFYNENNIAIFNRSNVEIDIGFMQTEYEDINDEIYKSYSIKGWLQNIFKGERCKGER